MASLESREILGPRERGERRACPAPGEKMALRVRRGVSDHLVSSDQSDWWERRVNLVFLAFLVILADWVPRDLLVSQDSLVPTARKEPGV